MEPGTFLPCIFHGHAPTARAEEDGIHRWQVSCYACLARGPYKLSEREAIDEWVKVELATRPGNSSGLDAAVASGRAVQV